MAKNVSKLEAEEFLVLEETTSLADCEASEEMHVFPIAMRELLNSPITKLKAEVLNQVMKWKTGLRRNGN